MMSLFFLNGAATPVIYTLSLHDALPISVVARWSALAWPSAGVRRQQPFHYPDRKSTRLNSSHSQISYAVFCLKKKKRIKTKINPVIDLHFVAELRRTFADILLAVDANFA